MTKPPFIRTGGVSVGGVRIGSGADGAFDGGSVDFDRGAFDELLKQKGYDVIWEKAAICPDRPRDSVRPGGHNMNCRICEGNGFVFFDSCPTQMLIQSARYNENFTAVGEWSTSPVMVTARPGHHLSYWDRISLNKGFGRFADLVTRQPSGDDFPKYKPLCVEYISWVDRTGQLQVFPNNSVVISSSGTLSWLGARPDSGSFYSISYTYRPRFIVLDLIHQFRDSPVAGRQLDFPVNVVAKADFLVRDESRDPPKVVDESPFRFS